MSVFEVGSKVQEVSIDEEDYPEKYKPVIRQLIRAIGNVTIRRTMDIEDEVFENLEKKERLLAKKDKIIESQEKELLQERQKTSEQEQIIQELKMQLDKLKNK